jgi:HAD superfamily hydrolase (TIGR02253 family)
MITTVVFDLDNTLVDFMAMKRNAIAASVRAMIDAGLRYSEVEINEAINKIYDRYGIEYQHVFNTVLQEMIGEVDHRILAAGIISYRRAREAMLVPYPHVHMTLFALARRGLRLAVVSDAPQLEAWLRLSYLNLAHIFDAVVTFEDTGVRKPNPEPFRRVLERVGTEPQHAIMVGDWEERDILGAMNVGMRTAFAKYGDTFNTRADYELADISDLIAIIDSINSTV